MILQGKKLTSHGARDGLPPRLSRLLGHGESRRAQEPTRQTVTAILTLLEHHIKRTNGEAYREESFRKYSDETDETDIDEKGGPPPRRGPSPAVLKD
ncbi:hypothetical protein N7468_004480 [Penicillium chermesinum]|uniref:Uncharacterized protein n=1 Tax=Penicillium chermesinum TaxID=63820 RepID=A0A9W9P9A0_9EURO|nr:uncharacterized protein N7468_004480 [Penicillium chermesinum]KAJ5239861.1 hypothetical protein N7468_004480 [Penicillium chermesinum]KAJ6166740.1 hypothetical protein N7470_002187 [Penicillium chermesinum]